MPFALHCIFISVDRFAEYCRQVYFATEEFDLSTFIVVNGGLFYAFGGRALVPEVIDDPDARAKYLYKYRTMCADNLVAALGSLSLFMPASAVNIEALLLGVSQRNSNSEYNHVTVLIRVDELRHRSIQTIPRLEDE